MFTFQSQIQLKSNQILYSVMESNQIKNTLKHKSNLVSLIKLNTNN